MIVSRVEAAIGREVSMVESVLGGVLVRREGLFDICGASHKLSAKIFGAFGLDDGGKKLSCDAGIRWRTGDGGLAVMGCISNDWEVLGDLGPSAERERAIDGR
jgi:hypothetical protein